MNYLCEIKIWNKFLNKLRTGLQLVAVRSRRGPRLVADRSPTSRRPIADQSPTSFNDSHAPILLKLVGDRSATSRRLIGDWSATSPGPVCDQISRSQVFVQAQKPGCDWFGRNEVPDQSPTSLQPRRDRSGTLLRPLRSMKIVSREEVAERLQCMSDWGLTGLATPVGWVLFTNWPSSGDPQSLYNRSFDGIFVLSCCFLDFWFSS